MFLGLFIVKVKKSTDALRSMVTRNELTYIVRTGRVAGKRLKIRVDPAEMVSRLKNLSSCYSRIPFDLTLAFHSTETEKRLNVAGAYEKLEAIAEAYLEIARMIESVSNGGAVDELEGPSVVGIETIVGAFPTYGESMLVDMADRRYVTAATFLLYGYYERKDT